MRKPCDVAKHCGDLAGNSGDHRCHESYPSSFASSLTPILVSLAAATARASARPLPGCSAVQPRIDAVTQVVRLLVGERAVQPAEHDPHQEVALLRTGTEAGQRR